MKKYVLYFIATCVAVSTGINAQTITPQSLALPDISVIGNMSARNGQFGLDEMEFGFQQYIAPTVKGNVFFSFHNQDNEFKPELEEAYLNYGGVIENVGLTFGKKRLNFGKDNPRHPEQWTMTDFPLVLATYLGEEGINAQGGTVEFLLPLPFFCQLELGSWTSKTPSPSTLNKDLILGRIWSSFELDSSSELQWGLSYLKGAGEGYLEGKDSISLYGTDLSYSLLTGTYSKFTSQTEAILMSRQLPSTTLTRWGMDTYIGYRFDKVWECGLRADYVQLPQEQLSTLRTLTVQIGHHYSDQSQARVFAKYNDNAKDVTYGFQLLFGFGPHSHGL